MRWVTTAAIIAALGFATGASAEALKTSFSLVGQTFDVTLPEGYCVPRPGTSAAETAAMVAAADVPNQTDLTFFDCSAEAAKAGAPRYGMIKTPKASLVAVIPDRPTMLAGLKTMIDSGSLDKEMAQAEGRVKGDFEKSMHERTGQDLKVGGLPRFVGVDDKAAYMTGVLNVSAGGRVTPGAMASAITTVKGRIFSYALYGPYKTDADVAALLAKVKVGIARFIADNGG